MQWVVGLLLLGAARCEELARQATVERVAVVEVSPYGEPMGHADESRARLSDDRG